MDHLAFLDEYYKNKIKGVGYSPSGRTWRAYWKDEKGRNRGKSFKVNKYGFLGAHLLALQAREEFDKRWANHLAKQSLIG